MKDNLVAPLDGDKLQTLRIKLKSLLDLINVRRIIAVDDEFGKIVSIEEYISVTQLLLVQDKKSDLSKTLGEDLSDYDEETIITMSRERWERLDEEQQKTLYEALLVLSGQQSAPDHVNDLHEIFSGLEFHALSPQQWNQQKFTLVAEASEKKTLFLFDENQNKKDSTNEDGLNQIAFVLQNASDEIAVCALLSHTFTTEGEAEAWASRIEKLNLNAEKSDRFIPISKERLRTDPSKLIGALRLAGLSKFLKSFREKALKALDDAQRHAHDDLTRLNVFDFEHALFTTSDQEGVSEMDTLFRMYNAIHRQKARKQIRNETSIREESRRLRRLRELTSTPPFKGSDAFLSVRRLELYDEPEDLNMGHVPIDLGDLFRHKNGKLYILLGPQCDFMIRAEGRKIDEGLLVEITKRAKVNSNQLALYHELPPFEESSSKELTYVSFQASHGIKLEALDPVVYSPTGEAKLCARTETPVDVLEHWRKHFERLKSQLQTELLEYKEWRDKGIPDDLLARLVRPVSAHVDFLPTINTETECIDYGFQRVGRLTATRSSALLVAYMQFVARPAFEHDFARSVK